MAQMAKHLPTMWETRVQSLGQEDPLEKEMATYSSTLAWKIPWMEEPGRSQRVGHSWVTSLCYTIPQAKGGIWWRQSKGIDIPSYEIDKGQGCNQFSSVAQLCLTLCESMDCRMTGLSVHYQLLEFTQTHVHWVGDAIQPSHPLSSPSPPTFNLSQHQGLFQWVNSSHQVAEVLEFQLQHQSFQWIFRTDFL